MNKLIWYIKQLLPMKYHTTYTAVTPDGNKRVIAVWRMWFGRQFWVEQWELKDAPLVDTN
jgi:hypothetical protein